MIDTQSKSRSIQIGHRVQVQDQIGTVKYIGELDGHKGTWLGLDWDDPSRGKHDGSVKGIQYFTASTSTSGSFVRPEKVSVGINLIDSITSRYGHQEDEEEMKYNQVAFMALEHQCNMPFLELVGFDGISTKQSNYPELKVLTVRMMNVAHLGDTHQFSLMCPNVEEFDLSKNMIHSWEEVFVLASELKHLHNLNICENRLVMPADISSYQVPHLKTLICGTMALSMSEIENLALVFPNLQTLIAPYNQIRCLESTLPLETLFHRLEALDLEGNKISDWSEIMKLKHLPNLKNLNLINLQLTKIRIEEDNVFKSLNTLNLKNNQISDLESLSNLNKLKSLTALGISRNPIYNLDTHQMVNQIIVAMISSLQVLNGGTILDERKGAEIDYMKKYGLEWLQVQKDEEAKTKFLQTHTRYQEFIEKMGELEESELKHEAKTIKESLIELNLVYEGKEIRKKVPPSLQVQKLVTLCQRLFRLSTAPALVYISIEQPNIEYDLDENREISLYSVQTGDKIVVKC